MSARQEGATALQVGRIALVGTISGAIIGGLASFTGTYLTYRQQRDIHDADTKRTAYVKLISEAEQYRLTLDRLHVSAERKDQATYAKVREKALAEDVVDLYASVSTVYMISDKEVGDKATAISKAFFSVVYIPASLEDFAVDAARKAKQDGANATVAFSAAARTDLQQD
jgi:hypothetical protein